ncbi:MAG: ribonuclease HIII [Mycoplasmataceae bacterium]|jgi:ribonuclease HIII|nr:ribonuclease HIII [Mycoplasmataceae bacterium]
MQNFTTILSKHTIKEIDKRLSQYRLRKPNNPHLSYFYKIDNTTISIFTNGKLLIQGENAKQLYDSLIGDEKKIDYKKVYKNTSLESANGYIGCDEVGVGDYFGGLVTCAVYLKKKSEQILKSIGVRDSKDLSDSDMLAMYPKIMRVCEIETYVTSPNEYNQLVNRFKNTHIVKAYMHDTTIKKLVNKIRSTEKLIPIVMDQFVARNAYYAYFKKFNIEPYEITHFETKAENKYLAVAAASIVARVIFIKQVQELSIKSHIPLLLGASNPKIISQAKLIYQQGGMNKLKQFAKIDFATTKKVIV